MYLCDLYRTKKYASFSVADMSCARILKQQASCIYHQTLHEFIYKVTLINIGRQNWYIFFVIITFYISSKAFLCTPRISKWQPWVFVKFVITKWNYCSYCIKTKRPDWQADNKENQVQKEISIGKCHLNICNKRWMKIYSSVGIIVQDLYKWSKLFVLLRYLNVCKFR